MSVFFIVYASSATVAFSRADLLVLLEKSRANNTRAGVSGMLLYQDGNFIQVLEGDEVQVRALYDRIARDPRHSGVLVLHEGRREQRQFEGWAMAFRDLGSDEVRAMPGYSDWLNRPLTPARLAGDSALCWRLLEAFRQVVR
jgi:hypothetical protein